MKAERFQRMKSVVDKIMDAPEAKAVRDDMNRFLKMYKGEWWNEKNLKDGDTKVAMNYIFSTVAHLAPLLTDNRPQWSVRARKPFLQPLIEGWKLSSEYTWDALDMDMKLCKAVMDALIMKKGIAEVCFDPDAEAGGGLRVEIIDPRDFFVAPGYEDLWDAPMCGTRSRVPISFIRGAYPKEGKKVKPDQPEIGVDYAEKEDFELHSEFCTLYKVWFKDDETESYFIDEYGKETDEDTGVKETRKKNPNGKWMIFTPEVFLEEKPSDYNHGKPPYADLNDYLVPHEFWGQGEAEQIEHMNKSFNRALQLLDHWVRDYCDAPWLLDSQSGIEKDQAEKAILDGSSILLYNGTVNPDPLKKVNTPPPNTAVNQLPSGLAKLIEEETGITDISKGITSKSERQSATEISTLAETSYTRTRQKVRNVEHFVKRIYYMILALQQQYYSEPRDYNYPAQDKSGAHVWDTISNQRSVAERYIQPSGGNRYEMGDTEAMKDEQAEKDYAAFKEYISALGPEDPVYVAFDIEIQTNSTLPMDKQSMANLFIRLLEMAGGNPVTGMPMWKATLENLRIPKYQELIQDMEENFQKSNAPKMPPGAPAGGQ